MRTDPVNTVRIFRTTPPSARWGQNTAYDRTKITRTEIIGHEEWCRFRSIKKTNDLRANHTKPTKADWTPVTDILAHCKDGDATAVVKMRLTYDKGSLSIEIRK